MLSKKYKGDWSNIFGAVCNGCGPNLKALLDNKKCSSLIYVIKKSS